jgi:hypothetical protein
MKRKMLSAALFVMVGAFSGGAQTNGVRDRMASDGPITQITDDAQVSARFDRIAGDWNILYVTVPSDRHAPEIFHIAFNHSGSVYLATFTAIKSGIGTGNTTLMTIAPPFSYSLTDVDDATEGGFARTQLVFQRAYIDESGRNITGSFVIFLVPSTGRIMGMDFADFPTGDSTVVPGLDGYYAGVRGGVPDIDTFEPMAQDLSHQYALKPANEQAKVFADWAGYGK